MPQSCRSASVTGPEFRSIAEKLNQETKLENVISNDIKSDYVAYQGKIFDGGISPSWKQPLFKPAVG
uniref:Uncharacterized protein n=1 Tax=Salix viminalis TaxID=40686 RepID=A0A6N2LU06_SALVM